MTSSAARNSAALFSAWTVLLDTFLLTLLSKWKCGVNSESDVSFTRNLINFVCPNMGWGCSSVGRASDRHTTDAGSISRCDEGFFSRSQLWVQTLLLEFVHPRVQLHALTSAHVKDPVVLVRVPWIRATLKHLACTGGLGSSTLSQQAFPGESNPLFPWKNSQSDNIVIHKKTN